MRPGSLLRLRSHWNNYKLAKCEHGQRSIPAFETLSQFNVTNAIIHKCHVTSQVEYEASLIHHMKENPKLFHSYIHHKKIDCTSVGPPYSTTGELSDYPQAMAESFSKAFSLVNTSHNLPSPAPFQSAPGALTDINVDVQQVATLLQDLDPFTAIGPDGIHPCS